MEQLKFRQSHINKKYLSCHWEQTYFASALRNIISSSNIKTSFENGYIMEVRTNYIDIATFYASTTFIAGFIHYIRRHISPVVQYYATIEIELDWLDPIMTSTITLSRNRISFYISIQGLLQNQSSRRLHVGLEFKSDNIVNKNITAVD